MLELPRAMIESLQYPQRLHAALVHLPIGAAVFGLLLLILLVFTRARSGGLRWAVVALYLAGMALAIWTEDAGKDAAGVLVTSGIQRTAEARNLLHQHAEMGENVWIFLLVTAALTAATTLHWRFIRVPALVLAVAAGLIAATWVGITGYYGGELVYVHGLGVPTSPNNLPLARALPDEAQTPPLTAPHTLPSVGALTSPATLPSER
jgi:uncharacterized membrane protein